MANIFHITTRHAWDEAAPTGAYWPEAFPNDGFIHCSTEKQVVGVANARFRGLAGLVLLVIDPEKVAPEIVYENLEGGEQLFPHIYGKLNTAAVVRVDEFEPGTDGYFKLPGEDSESRA